MTIAELAREAVVPVVLADHHGLITHVNRAFEDAFGWTAAALVGRSLTAIIPVPLRDAHHLGFSRFLLTGRPTLLQRPLALSVVCGDGREVQAEHVIHAECDPDGNWVFGATVRRRA